MAARIEELTHALVDAQRSGSMLNPAEWADAIRNEADAYAVNDGIAAAFGWPLRLWKSGGPGPQGPFSHAPVNPIVSATLLGVEAEVALRVARDITPEEAQGTLGDGVVDAMCISVECIASRWQQGLQAPVLLRMADLQCNGGILLGPWQPYRALDWPRLEWRLALADQPEIVRRGGHPLGNPAAVLPAWLRHVTRHGATVKAGTVVTTGAWGGVHACTAASARGTLTIEGLGQFSFSAARQV